MGGEEAITSRKSPPNVPTNTRPISHQSRLECKSGRICGGCNPLKDGKDTFIGVY